MAEEVAKKLVWDRTGERLFQTGVDHGIIFPIADDGTYQSGEVWNGLTGVTESPSGGESSDQYADNIKYFSLTSAEDFGLTVECFFYPDSFSECNGEKEIAPGVYANQQARKRFGFAYRNRIGNDLVGDSLGYELHLAYGCSSSPSETSRSTVNDSPEAGTFSFAISTTPVPVPDARPASHIKLRSIDVPKDKWDALMEILEGKDPTTEGGSDGVASRLPLPAELIELFQAAG